LWYSILQQTSKRIHKIDNHIFNKFYKNELFHQKSHIHRTFITYLAIRCFGTKVSTKNTSELTGQVSDISNNKGLSFASVTLLKKEGEKRNLQLALLPMKMAISNFRMSHWGVCVKSVFYLL
jgi:hypothetical protein